MTLNFQFCEDGVDATRRRRRGREGAVRESRCGFATVSFTRRDLPLYFESDDVQIAGLVVSNYSADPSHWASQQSLGNWLAKAGVPAIFGADSA